MPLDIEAAKQFIVAHLYEKADFLPRQDLLIDSRSREPEYSRKHLKIHSSVSDVAINQLVEERVLVELLSADLLEEIIRTGLPEDDSFADRPNIQAADEYSGDSIICLGPRLNFFVLENFANLVEMAEDSDFPEFKNFCFEVATSTAAGAEDAEQFVARSDVRKEVERIEVALAELERRLMSDNDLSRELVDRREVILSELRSLRTIIAGNEFRPSVALGIAKRTLGWIADKAGGAAVGAAAVALLAMLAGLVG
jgi:hypothetical protein